MSRLAEQTHQPGAGPGGRLVSLDALRGFDMLWILGTAEMATIPRSLGSSSLGALVRRLDHAPWHGFNFYDLIFPLFVFIAGTSLTLAVRRRLAAGERKQAVFGRLLRRSLLLYLLGVFRGGGVSGSPLLAHLPLTGVLQRIAVCYLVTGALLLVSGTRTRAWSAAGILGGYWLAMRFIPVPGVGAGVWTPGGNLAAFVDARVLPGGVPSAEGILSSLPALASCLMGALAGDWLLVEGRPGPVKAGGLAAAGVLTAAVGLLWGNFFPLNKHLWTSSFALLTGGISAALLALFYWAIDVRGWQRWAFPLVVVGLNSLVIYLAVKVVPFAAITARLVGGDIAGFFGPYRGLFLATAQIVLEWLCLYWLYRRRIFIRV